MALPGVSLVLQSFEAGLKQLQGLARTNKDQCCAPHVDGFGGAMDVAVDNDFRDGSLDICSRVVNVASIADVKKSPVEKAAFETPVRAAFDGLRICNKPRTTAYPSGNVTSCIWRYGPSQSVFSHRLINAAQILIAGRY